MLNEVNTTEKVKIQLTFDTIARIRAALPANSHSRIARELDMTPQIITNEFNQVKVAFISEDRLSRLIDRSIIAKAIEIIQETGNTSFDHILIEQ